MADLEELLSSLGEETVVEIDYDAPEPGQFPPQLAIGDYDFIFHLPENASERWGEQSVVVNGVTEKHLQLTFEAEVQRAGQDPVRIKYLRVSDFRSPKMTNSDIGNLVRSLAIRPEGPGRRELANALIAADGRARGRAQFGWSRYCKDCQLTVATSPRKKKAPKKSDAPWPRGADKQPELIVACPSCGGRGYGREYIVNFRLPETNGNAAA